MMKRNLSDYLAYMKDMRKVHLENSVAPALIFRPFNRRTPVHNRRKPVILHIHDLKDRNLIWIWLL